MEQLLLHFINCFWLCLHVLVKVLWKIFASLCAENRFATVSNINLSWTLNHLNSYVFSISILFCCSSCLLIIIVRSEHWIFFPTLAQECFAGGYCISFSQCEIFFLYLFPLMVQKTIVTFMKDHENCSNLILVWHENYNNCYSIKNYLSSLLNIPIYLSIAWVIRKWHTMYWHLLNKKCCWLNPRMMKLRVS